jgi:GNAT superfamily N-acetyltransferase
MRLLAEDEIGASRGDRARAVDEPLYRDALRRVVESRENEIILALDADTINVVGALQLTVTPGMSRRGSTRLTVESVRVTTNRRASGIGSALMRWVIDVAAPDLHCSLVQLTSAAERDDAHRFYERLGFSVSHVGFKYQVPLPKY